MSISIGRTGWAFGQGAPLLVLHESGDEMPAIGGVAQEWWGKAAAGLMLGLLCWASSAVLAQAGVTEGVAWLIAHQDGSGLWGATGGTPFRDATAAITALGSLQADSVGVFSGLAAINAMAPTSTDYAARRMLANTSSSSGQDVAGMADELLGRRNAGGGWGYDRRYSSNVLETALAVQALKSAAGADTATLGPGVRYLTSHQSADQGWAFIAGDTSRVFFAAHALLALEAVRDSFEVAASIASGITWLKAQAHADGGFGTGAGSNAYETALALLALAPVDSLAPEFADGLNYLRSTQRPDGSWNGDAYSTALAVQAMRSTATVGVETPPRSLVLRFAVAPNPARATATVALTLPERERVRLAVYDVAGRLARLLVDAELGPGERSLTWDLRSADGARVPPGAYYVHLTYGAKTMSRKLVLTR